MSRPDPCHPVALGAEQGVYAAIIITGVFALFNMMSLAAQVVWVAIAGGAWAWAKTRARRVDEEADDARAVP